MGLFGAIFKSDNARNIQKLEKIAKNEERTVTNLINMVLKNYIERYNGVNK